MSSFKYNNVYINNYYTLASKLEQQGNLKKINYIIDDYYFEEKTFEQAEIKMQQLVIDKILSEYHNQVDLVFGGELSNQIATTSYSLAKYNFPIIGIYSACATFNESLILAANMIDSSQINNALTITSSHALNTEKQFRYPVEYGAPKPERSTITATGAVSCILSSKKSPIKITASTIGKVIDYGIKDAFNMGAVMAPAAAETLYDHLLDLNKKITDYDLVLTGDLGIVGSKLFKEYLLKKYDLKIKKHIDAGEILYKKEQKLNAGSSGPCTLPLVLFNKILKEKKYSKILLLATGSLHSPVVVNQKLPIPSISHAISLEVNLDALS